MEKLLISAMEFAETQGFPINKVYDLMNIEGFPIVKFGRRKFISVKGYEKWIDEQVAKNKNEADC